MSKFTKLTAVLALAEIPLHSNFFGTKKPFAKLEEDQLQAIEDALATNDTAELEQKVNSLTESNTALQTTHTEVENAVNDALALNGLTIPENSSLAEAIALLGNAKATATHEIPPTNGEEAPSENGLVDNFFDPNAPHNKID